MLKKLIKYGINLFWPHYCLQCNCSLDVEYKLCLCRECISKIKYNKPPFCKICGKSLVGLAKEYRDHCKACVEAAYNFERIYSACIYDGVIKDALHAFKYGKNINLGITLSNILLDFFSENMRHLEFDALVPIPLFSARQREREFNQSAILAKPIADKFSLPLELNNLIKTKQTRSQVTLSKDERLLNQKGVFKVKRPDVFCKKNVLVVDDIFTTGSTINEASLELKKCGANSIIGLTLIRGFNENT